MWVPAEDETRASINSVRLDLELFPTVVMYSLKKPKNREISDAEAAPRTC